MAQIRPWHLLECPARSARVRIGECTCPPERFLDELAGPVPEPGDTAATCPD